MTKAKKENFELLKFKIKDGKGIVDYRFTHLENPEKETREYKGVKIPILVHPDLKSLLSQLREYLLKDIYIEPIPENLMQLEINSISIENRICVISGELDCLHGGKIPVKSSKINLDESFTGLEEEIDAIADSIIDEAFEYVFKCKSSAPELFSELNDSEVDDTEVIDSEPLKNAKIIKGGLNTSSHATC